MSHLCTLAFWSIKEPRVEKQPYQLLHYDYLAKYIPKIQHSFEKTADVLNLFKAFSQNQKFIGTFSFTYLLGNTILTLFVLSLEP